MGQFKQTCKECGLVVEYDNIEELKKHFYFTGPYCRGKCKPCEKKEHAVKYKEGKYNYRNGRNKDVEDTRQFLLGSLDRSYQ